MSTLTLPFDDAPVLVINGLTVATVEGDATISYDRDGSFSITAVSLDGWRDKTTAELLADDLYKNPWTFTRDKVVLSETDPRYAGIKAFIEHDRGGCIADKIAEALEDERVNILATRAEHRRELMAGA